MYREAYHKFTNVLIYLYRTPTIKWTKPALTRSNQPLNSYKCHPSGSYGDREAILTRAHRSTHNRALSFFCEIRLTKIELVQFRSCRTINRTSIHIITSLTCSLFYVFHCVLMLVLLLVGQTFYTSPFKRTTGTGGSTVQDVWTVSFLAWVQEKADMNVIWHQQQLSIFSEIQRLVRWTDYSSAICASDLSGFSYFLFLGVFVPAYYWRKSPL